MYNVVSSYLFHRLFVSTFCAISYVQDTESTLYYLQSRYYDPEMDRFINADSYASTGQGILGSNMFAYCGNNPICRADSEGKFFGTIIGAIGGAISGGIWGLFEGKTGDELEACVLSNATSGLVNGIAADVLLFTGATGGLPAIIMAGAGALGAVLGTAVESEITGEEKGFSDYLIEAAWGAGFGALGGYMGGDIASQIPTIKDYGFSYVAYQIFEEGDANFGKNFLIECGTNLWTSLTRAALEVYPHIIELLSE